MPDKLSDYRNSHVVNVIGYRSLMPAWIISQVAEIDDRIALVIILDEREAWKVNPATRPVANTTCLAPCNVPEVRGINQCSGLSIHAYLRGKTKEAGLGVSLTSI